MSISALPSDGGATATRFEHSSAAHAQRACESSEKALIGEASEP